MPEPVLPGGTAVGCTRRLQIVRLSKQFRHLCRGGWSHIYLLSHHVSHTFSDLAGLLASMLRVNRRKLCFFGRIVDYHDDRFHLPMWRRLTTSTFVPLEPERLLDNHVGVYLHIARHDIDPHDQVAMAAVASNIHISAPVRFVEGAGRPLCSHCFINEDISSAGHAGKQYAADDSLARVLCTCPPSGCLRPGWQTGCPLMRTFAASTLCVGGGGGEQGKKGVKRPYPLASAPAPTN
eukprot:6490204-Amphidinium_carterae.1